MVTLQIVWKRPALYELQEAAIFGPERFACVEASVKSGKTMGCLAWITERALETSSSTFWWVAPTYSQSSMAYRRLKSMLPREVVNKVNETALSITLANGSVIWFRSGDRPDHLYGEDVTALVVDEASRLSETSWHAVRSTLSATGGSARLVGNVSGRTWFWSMCRRIEAGEHGEEWTYARLTWEDAAEAGVIGVEDVDEARRNLPPSVFEALYMAHLTADIEQVFAVDRIEVIPATGEEPEVDNIVRSWDLASSTHRGSSHSVGVLMGIDYDADRVVIGDVVRGKWDAGGTLAALMATAAKDTPAIPILIEEEKGSSGRLLIENIAQRLPDHKVIHGVIKGDKVTRSFGLAAAVGRGAVSVVSAEWTDPFLAELAGFPFTGAEDTVDAASHGYNHLEELRAKIYPKANFWKPTLPVRDRSIA